MNDKEILDKMNKDENYRSDVLINFNFEMQLAERICYTHENKFSPQEYKLAVVSLEQENARLKEENQALLTLVNWFEECGMGFDNIAQDDIINWEKFEEETEDMSYIESMIYYAKKYNEKQNLKEN